MEPRDADIILVHGKGFLSSLIRIFQDEPGESAQFNHIGLFFTMHPHLQDDLSEVGYQIPDEWRNQPCVIEALWRVTISHFEEFKAARQIFSVATTSQLSMAGRERIVRHALTYAAQPYSITRLLAQGWEKLTGYPMTLKFGPGQVICSSLIALPYWVELGLRFEGKSWRQATPDDIGDHVQKYTGWRTWVVKYG